ncbi:MAG: hypothetical protein Q7R54_02790 [bacterium]|nr:hypothetical protein [bacterium]
MHRLNCWMCMLLAAFFCFAFLPYSAFAVEDKLSVIEAEIQAFEQKNAQQKAEVAKLNARIDALNDDIAKLVVQFAADEQKIEQLLAAVVADIDVDSAGWDVIEVHPAHIAFLGVRSHRDSLEADLDALVEKKERLYADVAMANAQVVVDDTLGGPRIKKVLPRASSEPAQANGVVRAMPVPPENTAPAQAVTLVKQIIVDRHTPSLYRYWQRQDTLYKKAHPWGDQYCRSVTWLLIPGEPCDSAIWKHLSVGDSLFVPAGNVYAQVAHGVKVPKVIALAPTVIPGLLALDPPQSTAPSVNEKIVTEVSEDVSWTNMFAALAIIFGFLALLLFVCLQNAWKVIRRHEDLNAKLRSLLGDVHTITKKALEDGCCKTETSPTSGNDSAPPTKDGC